MSEAPPPNNIYKKIADSLSIVQDDKKIVLKIEIKEEILNFIIQPQDIRNIKYSKTMNLNEIKEFA